jgi:ketosteroid isomerase-like protein
MKGMRRNRSRTLPLFAAIAALLLPIGGCGGDDGNAEETGPAPTVALTEAAPEAEPDTPAAEGELSEDDAAAVEAATRAYIQGLNKGDAAAVCALFAEDALDLAELPQRRGGCEPSLDASIGTRPANGGPAWRRTTIRELNEVSVGEGTARVTATVNHDFSDRDYVSIEEDVIYLSRAGGTWLLAKPSGTLYRAVGYPEPPLRALTPP